MRRRPVRKDKTMTLKEHLQTADDLGVALHFLREVIFRCQRHYPESCRLMKLLYRVHPGFLNGVFSQIKCELDGEYHRVITNSEFKEHGNIYYDFDEKVDRILSLYQEQREKNDRKQNVQGREDLEPV